MNPLIIAYSTTVENNTINGTENNRNLNTTLWLLHMLFVEHCTLAFQIPNVLSGHVS